MSAGKFGRIRETLFQWRNWSLPTKLATVLLVPALFAVTLGVVQVRTQIDEANEYQRVSQVLDAVDLVEPLLAQVQRERTTAVEYIVGDVGPDALPATTEAVDEAVQDVHGVFQRNDNYGPIVGERYRELQEALDALPQLRQQVRDRQIPPAKAIEDYTALATSVMSLDRALTSTVADRRLSSNANALLDLVGMMEEVRLQQAWVLTGLTEGAIDQMALQNLSGSRARLLQRIEDARATVAKHWQDRLERTLEGQGILERNQMLMAIIAETTDDVHSGSYSVDRNLWNQRSDDSVALINDGHSDLSDETRRIASELEDDASDTAGWSSVGLLLALALCAAVIVTITRQLLNSMSQLRSSALDAANNQLPAAVASIRAGARAEEVSIEPVPVTTKEEVGQLARAFDRVNQAALRLAAEQADLRRGVSDVFVSVSRRSQALLERQLRLFEELEQDEEDPDQLARLFQLDHLATRMRRNNENLMVLSGHSLVRRFTKPTDLADVLRAAVSEIEQYPRVTVQPLPSVKLRGNTASDMVRLMAELMDNAANFSAPDTTVTVSGYQSGEGNIVIDILDQGIGMSEEQLARANRVLASADEEEMATSRRMGLFVAGRLAARHDVTIELHGGKDVEGLRATVVIPADHVVGGEQRGPDVVAPAAEPGRRNGHSHPQMPTSGTFGTALGGPTESPAAPSTPAAELSSGASLFQSNSSVSEAPTEHLFDNAPSGPQPSAEPAELNWPSTEEVEQRPEPPRTSPQEGTTHQEATSQWFQPASENPYFKEQLESGGFSWPSDEEAQQSGADQDPGFPAEEPGGSGSQPTAGTAPATGQEGPQQPAETPVTASGLPRRVRRRKPEAEQPAASKTTRSAEEISRQLADRHNGIHFGQMNRSENSGVSPEAPAEGTASSTWNSGLDEARKAAEAAANPEPTSFTSAGLPRRTPKAHLVPGSFSGAFEDSASAAPPRDAKNIRGRLADFQSGVRRGRHRANDEE